MDLQELRFVKYDMQIVWWRPNYSCSNSLCFRCFFLSEWLCVLLSIWEVLCLGLAGAQSKIKILCHESRLWCLRKRLANLRKDSSVIAEALALTFWTCKWLLCEHGFLGLWHRKAARSLISGAVTAVCTRAATSSARSSLHLSWIQGGVWRFCKSATLSICDDVAVAQRCSSFFGWFCD